MTLTLTPARPIPTDSLRDGRGAFRWVEGARSEPVVPKPRTKPIEPLSETALAMMAASGAIVKARV